jgi:two-component system nitrate/nitrite response regulator NarL
MGEVRQMGPGVGRVRVLIVDDHKLFADAIRSLLEGAGMEILGVATSADDAITAARRGHPELVLLDIGLPEMSGIRLGERIIEGCPKTKVLALTALNDHNVVRGALRAGFHGYLTKDIPASQLITSIKAVLDGQVLIPHKLARATAGGRSVGERDAELLAAQLTPREREVLALLVEGATSQAIAKTLSVRPNTARTHIQSILTKLGVHSRLEAAGFAARYGLVAADRDRRYA